MTNDEMISLVLNAFSPISAIHTDGAAADTDTVLFVVPDSSNNLVGGKMPASVLRAYLTKALNPTINSSGYWVIGSTVTTIKAEGVTPLIRRGTNGIEASTDKGATYNTVALWSDLRPDFAGMSAEEKAAFKFNYSDFTAEEIAALQKPATDAVALVTDHITLCDAAKDAANTAAASANAAATLATSQANRCKAFADNPIKIQSGTWWVWDEASSAYKDTGVSPTNYVLTKSEVERVLTGAITSHSHAYLPLAGGAMGNTNLVTNLNADMIDGYHNGSLTANFVKPIFKNSVVYSVGHGLVFGYCQQSTAGVFPSIDNTNMILQGNIENVNYNFQMGFSSNGKIYYRKFTDSIPDTTTAWKQLAFITDNVASASKCKAYSIITGDTVGDVKNKLVTWLSDYNTSMSVGDSCVISASVVTQWDQDSATTYPTNIYSFTKIGGGYTGVAYGQWLLSSYNTFDVGIVGRDNEWSSILWVLSSKNFNRYCPSLNGTGASGTWGISILGNSTSATKLQTARKIWGQTFDGTNDVNGIIHTAASITTLNNHVNRDLAFLDGIGSVGTIAIKLPTKWNNSMNMYRIMIYEYRGNGASEILLGGFNYEGQCFATNTAAISGKYDKAIRFASDGTNNFILLGNPTTDWGYVKVVLDTVYTHKISEEWMSGYSISLITDESQFTYLTDDLPRNNIHVSTIYCQYNAYIGGELHVSGATLLDSTLTCSGLLTARLGVRVSNGSQSVDLTVDANGNLLVGGKAVQVAA